MLAPATEKYIRNPQSATRIIEGKAFVITPMDHKLHTLNETATILWELAANGCTVRQAADHLVATYDVDTTQAIADIKRCFADLIKRSVLVLSDSSS